jgi:SpoIID/LytB domain protein
MRLFNAIDINVSRYHWYGCLLVSASLGGLTVAVSQARFEEPELKIGIIQRFGNQSSDRLTLIAPRQDRLKLKFLAANGQQGELVTDRVDLSVKLVDTPDRLEERLVVGNYRNFETAQNTVEILAQQGIKLEIAQPHSWQVWAKRDVYHHPHRRRQLLTQLQQGGNPNAYLDARLSAQENQLTWVSGGRSHLGKELEITSKTNTILVQSNLFPSARRFIYPGKLRLQSNAYGSYTLVNQVPLETYLRGVVPHEIDPNAPYHANAAQAIIARTYALQNLHRFEIDQYHLCADTQCQVYRGLTDTNATADRAIADTRHQVLTYQGKLIDALYSSTNGGMTASFNEVWNGVNRPYLRPQVDSLAPVWDIEAAPLDREANLRRFIAQTQGFNESKWKIFRWRKDSTLVEIKNFLNLYLDRTRHPISKIDRIDELTIADRGTSGRVTRLVVKTDKGPIELSKDDIRGAFAAPVSTLFYLQPTYDRDRHLMGYTFIGGGMGHGVGLSQTGAYSLARRGKTFREILKFYYPGTQLQQIQTPMLK